MGRRKDRNKSGDLPLQHIYFGFRGAKHEILHTYRIYPFVIALLCPKAKNG